MGIMDMFKSAPAPQQPPQAGVNAPTAVPTPGNPNLPIATTPAPGANNPPDASSLDAHTKLWETDPTKTSAPAPLFDIDPTKFAEAVKTADFTKLLPPDILAKALAGDAAAFQQSLNGVAQQVFSHQTMATTKLIEQALDKRDATLRGQMPDMVRAATVRSNLSDHPLYQHEATRPLIAALEQQLAMKHPTATAAQITEQAQNYIRDFAKLAGGNQQAAAKDPNEVDWANF